jgi:ubiquinone/menaquinone biosynthesis C-methylase UbiE
MAVLLCIAVGIALLAGGYWLLIVAEGSYFGPYAVRAIYTAGAPYYDQVRAAVHADDQHVLLPLLQAELAGRIAPCVLDVACGTGRVPLLLATMPGWAGTIAALDLTPAMLRQALLRQALESPEAPISWQIAEAGRLPWSDMSFDLVTCLEALEYMPRPRRALAEMVRVLRPGGVLIVSKFDDGWARLMPGRALTSVAFRRVLAESGLHTVEIRTWQPGHYDLVIAH